MEENHNYSEEGLGNVADASESKYELNSLDTEDVFVISRVVVNYVIIAVTFLLVGIAIGGVVFRSTSAPIDETRLADIVQDAVVTAINEQIGDGESEELDENTVYTVSPDDDPAIGPDDALVTIVEFSDFRCGYCGRFARETLPQLLEDYGDRVRFVYRDFPIFGDLSILAAMAAECAHDQGKFWDYHNLLFENASQISSEFFSQSAEQVELDLDVFNTCMEDQAKYEEVIADYQAGQELGQFGTPTFFVNGKPIIGAQPYQVFVSTIDEALLAAEEAGANG